MITIDTEPVETLEAESAEVRVGNFLQEHTEIETIAPVVLGLFVTNRLQLRGANALIANLAIASLVREVFVQLKKSAAVEQPRAVAPSPARLATEDYAIVHSVPGRVRLRVPRLGVDRAFARRLETLLKANDRVLGVRINRAATSVAIEYDAGDLSEWQLAASLLGILQAAQAEPDEQETDDDERS